MLARPAAVLVILAVPAAVWLVAAGREGAAGVVAPAAQSPRATAARPPVGMAGCAAAACHGDPAGRSLTAAPDENCWRGAFTHWRAADPHTRAYRVLGDESAARIVKALATPGKDHPPATEDVRCLACHTNPTLAPDDALTDRTRLTHLRADGIGCEGCHGNASAWQYTHAGWKTADQRQAGVRDAGYIPLHDVGERALACAGCHVGAPADRERGIPLRDMNHDMIAAGHPRLNFEFADYQRRLPPHWLEGHTTDPGRDAARRPGSEAKAWLVGTVATAEAACLLLADRADREKHGAPWPELSEGNCFACHHALVPESWRGQAPGFYTGRKPGETPWQSRWPLKGLPGADDGFKIPGWDAAAVADMANLRKAVEARRPDPVGTHHEALKLADRLRTIRTTRLAALSEGEASAIVRGILSGPATADGELNRMSWDDAGRAYHGFAALEHDRVPPAPDRVPVVNELRAALLLPRKTADSPPDYTPARVRDLFDRLR